MPCCGSKRLPGNSPANAITLGDPDVSGSTVYARITERGANLVHAMYAGNQAYFTGSGVVPALNEGLLLDVSASAVSARRRETVAHEFMVVSPGGERERYGVWTAAQKRAKVTGGRIEVVPVEAGGE